ncbi:putative nuclear pore complex protein [Trypoxylus dichotomus]
MAQIAPSPLDTLDFQFKLHCRLKVFDCEGASALNIPYNLVAVASKYGLLFVGTVKSFFQVIQLQSIQQYSFKEGNIGNYYRRNVLLSSNPQHLSVNCDYTKLCVVIKDDCVKAVIYDIASFLQENIRIYQEVRLSHSSDVNIVETIWNPTISSFCAVCRSDGSLAVYDIKETAVEINELPKSTGATCMCWSPKGKQLAVGSKDGRITQYKPDLKIAKVIDCPPLEGLQYPVALQWISNYQFIAIYATSKNDQCNLIVINNPKKGDITYINYEDICYSYGNTRLHQFYLYFQNVWNILLVASSNSMEVGVLGFEKDIWRQWILTDAARAELPLNATNQDTLPIGLAFDTSSSQPLSWGEGTIPPAPLLLLLSNDGILCGFYAINLKEGAAAICRLPETLNNTLSSPYFTRNSDPIEQLPNKSIPSTSINKQQVSGNLPQFNNAFSFTFNQKSKPACSVKSLQASESYPILASTPLKSTINLTENISTTCEKSQIENLQSKTQPLQQSAPIPGKQLGSIKLLDSEFYIPSNANEDPEPLITQIMKEEYTTLGTEFKLFEKNNRNFKINLGADKEMINLVQTGNNLQVFLEEINDICQSQIIEVYHLKQNLVQNWAWYEEVKSRFTTSKDPSLITLVQAQPLDAASARQLEEIRHLLYYLQSQMIHASAALDEQWEIFQNSCKKKLGVKLPNIEAIYQSMVKQSAIVQKQVYLLRDISNRIKISMQVRTTPHLLVSVDVNKLEEKLDNLQLSSDLENLFQIQYKRVFERQKQLTANKSRRLVKLLKSRCLNTVCITKPQLNYKTIQLNGLSNTLLSPIPPKKELQPQRLSFMQSTPKTLDKHKGSLSGNIGEEKMQQSTSSEILSRNLPKTEPELNQNISNLVSTKSDILIASTALTLSSNVFGGEVKTPLGSAFVPTAQNNLGCKSGPSVEIINSIPKSKPKNIFSNTVPTSVNEPSSNLIFTVTTTDTHKDMCNVKPTSVTATVPKFLFGNLSFNVTGPETGTLTTNNATPKINFNFTNLSKTEDITTSTNLSPKTVTVNTSLLGSSTFPTFKPSNNISTSTSSSLRLSTAITPVITPTLYPDGITTAMSSTAVSNTSFTFAKSFEALSPSNTQFTPLSNKIGTSTNTTPSALDSKSIVSTTSNTSLDLTITNTNKGSICASLSSASITDDSKRNIASEHKTVDTPTIIQSCTATPVSLFSPPTTSFTFCNFTTGSIFSNSQTSTTSAIQIVQSNFGSAQQLVSPSFFGSSQQAQSPVLTESQKILTTSSSSPVTTNAVSISTSVFEQSGVSLFANSSSTTCTSTTTSAIFGANSVVNTTKSPLFSIGATPTSTTATVFVPKTSQSFVFDMNTNTKVQTPHFETSSNSILFGGHTNVPNTSRNVFDISSAGPLLSNSKGISTNVFGSSPTTFSSTDTNSTSFFASTNSATPAFGQSVTFGSTSIFSSPNTTNAGGIFGISSAGPTNVFGNTVATTSSPPFSTVFGSSGINTHIFGSSSDPFRFPATTGTSETSGNFGFSNKPLFTTFGNNSSSTSTTTPSFGNPSSSSFGSGFTQNPFSRALNTEEKSPFSGGSLFGSTVTTSSSSIFSSASPFNKTTPTFGAPALFGQSPAFGNQNSAFGQSSFGGNLNVFGSSAQTSAFLGNNTSMNQSNFGASPVFGSSFGTTSPGGFGAPPTFASPAFSQNLPFSTANKPFPSTFGPSCQENSTFANLASQQTLGFESLAQQNQTPTSQAAFSGNSSFSNWR